MGNTNPKESLYEAIEADDCTVASEIIRAHPQIVNLPLSDKVATTPLARAAWRGNVEMINTLIELGADVNYLVPQQMSPLQWASIRGKEAAVYLLLEKGADYKFVSHENHNALDCAILYGSYNIALHLMELGLEPKDVKIYQDFADKKYIRYYNYEKMIQHLKQKTPLDECPSFTTPPPGKTYVDPVIDPRESWADFAKRILQFEEPPLVERQELPLELRPENRFLGRLRSFVNGQSPYPVEQPAAEVTEEQREETSKRLEASIALQVEDEEKKTTKRVEEHFGATTNSISMIDVEEIKTKIQPDDQDESKQEKGDEINNTADNLIRAIEVQPMKVSTSNKSLNNRYQ